MVAPARTGKDRRRRTAVVFTAQRNKVMRSSRIPRFRILMIEEIKFKAARIEEALAKWREKMAKSTGGPA